MKKFILAAIALVATCSVTCAKSSNITIPGKFTGLEVGANIEVVYTASATVSAKAVYDDEPCDLTVSLRDGVLKLGRKSDGNNKGKMKIILNAPIASKYILSGTANVEVRSDASFDKLAVSLSGASELEFMSVNASAITVITGGTSQAEFEYIMCEEISIQASGASDVSADGVTATGFTIESSGTSNVEVDQVAVAGIDAVASGVANIELDGTAGTVRYETSGTAQIDAGELTANGGSANASGASYIKCHVAGLHKSVSGTASIKNI